MTNTPKLRTNFKGIIFDIDGTLASTNELIFASFNHVINKYHGKILTNEEIIALFGPTEDVILKEWMKDDYEKARRDYYEFYESKHHEMTSDIEGIGELLVDIKRNDIPLGIFTGKGRESSEITLKKINALQFFDMIVTGDDVDNHKPSPDGINKFIREFKLNPKEVLMIGDAPVDVTAAHAAGCMVASVLWDNYASNKVLEMNSDFVAYTIDELRKLIFE